MQWTGDNETELRKFAGFRFTIIGDNEQLEVDNIDATARLLETPRREWAPLEPGDWVVRCRGMYTAVRAVDFAKDYELDGEAS
ncbi:hypothetical protein AUW26_28110 [Streptomyces sp. CC71]|nr:hypothetical protein AUW26_28110 [Streptomyces sp. CC71]